MLSAGDNELGPPHRQEPDTNLRELALVHVRTWKARQAALQLSTISAPGSSSYLLEVRLLAGCPRLTCTKMKKEIILDPG